VNSILAVFSFWTGACIASFLNVVIWRVPRGESIVFPASHCPKCNAPIRWYQNLPIVSWLCLRGKCANCKAPISPRYILIEALGGILFTAIALKVFGCRPHFNPWMLWYLLMLWIWISLMIVGSFIDYDHKLLPDFVTVGGMILGLVFHAGLCAINVYDYGWTIRSFAPFAHSVSGFAVGYGLLWLLRFFGSKAFGREAMGEGDVYLMGAVGAIFGPVAVLITLILSSVFGSVVGVGMVALSKTKFGKFVEIPYGPYICLGCLVWMFWGPELVRWYLSFLK